MEELHKPIQTPIEEIKESLLTIFHVATQQVILQQRGRQAIKAQRRDNPKHQPRMASLMMIET